MTAPTALNFGRDSHSYNAFAPYPSNNIFTATLTDGTASNCQVPTNTNYPYWCVSYRYQPGSSVFVDVTGATAAIPASGTLAASTSEGNPASHTLLAGTNISMITADTEADVSVVMWPIGQS
jgi:redox-sensitive bicupin YhaK (pirin superfamily)